MFVHFNIRSEYSVQDSILRISDVAKLAAKDDQIALGLTDLNNMFGAIKFYKTCLNKGIKPIIGMTVTIAGSGEVCLLAMNNEGYRSLLQLSECIWSPPQSQCSLEDIKAHSEGVIAILSDSYKPLHADEDTATDAIKFWSDNFNDRCYFAIKRLNRSSDDDFIKKCIYWGYDFQIPIIATNDIRFAQKDDYFAHEVRVCISQSTVIANSNRNFGYSEEQYFKSQQDMQRLFSDLPQVVQNTVNLASRCNVIINLGDACLPDYPIPDGESLESYFIKVSNQGLERRLEHLFPVESRGDDFAEIQKQYQDRLSEEISIISNMGFIGYFLIVMDFIGWAKDNDIPVGIGRGSGAGSLVAYSLDITDLDPISYNLLFERFLNPERVSMPDFDIDFCVDGRDRVIDYVKKTYGSEAVSQIITFGRLGAKAVIRDVCRVLSLPFGLGDRLAKLVPKTPDISLDEAIEQESQLYEILNNEDEQDYEDANEIFTLALKLEGIVKSVGRHAGGVLIAPNKIQDFSPVYYDEVGHLISQYDKNDVEDVGLVKFDFLGLRNLTVIKNAVDMVKEHLNPNFDISRIPLDDQKTFELLRCGHTTAVFQLESDGMKKYLKSLSPENIEDVIAMCALYRPGPLDAGMVEMFIDRKHGREVVEYLHPTLEPILKDTNGVIVYQEQVMKISQELAGYSLGGADLLRRAMGKKKPEEMQKQRAIFIDGAESLNVDTDIAAQVFDLMEKFAGYGFNRSHSAAYGMLAYQTAFLKAHYPDAFMSAVMSSEINNTDKIISLIEDCKQIGITLRAPCVNESGVYFKPASKPMIIEYALSAIKGVGIHAAEHIVEARNQQGKFDNIYELCEKTSSNFVGRRVLVKLIESGAMDKLNTRDHNIANYSAALKYGKSQEEDANNGMLDLFAEIEGAMYQEIKEYPSLDHSYLAEGEFQALGYYLRYHPIDDYAMRYGTLVSSMSELVNNQNTKGGFQLPSLFMGVVTDFFYYNGKAIFRVDDTTLQVQASMDDYMFRQYRDMVKIGAIVFISGRISLYNDKYYAFVDCFFTEQEMDDQLKSAQGVKAVN